MRFTARTCAAAMLILIACDSSDPTGQSRAIPGDPVRGQAAFAAACASCHASGDGADLATFHFADTTIVRRAVKHVDSTTARDIVAHIRTLQTPSLSEQTRIFQPGGSMLTSDVDFAFQLFGADAFPMDMTTDRMRAFNPRELRVAVAMPLWSDEEANLDWMPDDPVPAAILDDQGGFARAMIAGYRAVPTRQNLVRAIAALRSADRRIDNPGAPCTLDDTLRVNYMQCFEARRWTSTLAAQHLIRSGMTDQIELSLHDVWWDVGNVARRSIRNGVSVIPNARQNWAAWMYLSWSFAPSQHASVYTGGGMNGIGLPRHATFVALRSQVARGMGGAAPYEDARSAVGFAPAAWTYNVASFAFRHLNERLDAGDVPAAADLRQAARDAIAAAVMTAQRKVPTAQRGAIQQWGDALLARL